MIEVIKKMAKNINESTNVVIPYNNKFKQIVKIYFKNNQVKEISFKDFCTLTGLNLENSKRILIEMNKDLFIN